MAGGSGPGDLYELLGVQPGAPAVEITRACRRRARALHPGAQGGQAGEPARFQEVAAACRVLRDPARRAAYDQALRQAARTAAAPPRTAAAPSRPAAAWPRPGRWPAARPPGAMVWAGPVRVTPPAASPAGPSPGPVSSWLAALAGGPGSALGWDWDWPW